MATLIKPRGMVGRPSTTPAATSKPGGFRFQYRPRTPEEIRERASRTTGRDTYISSDAQLFVPHDGPNTVRIMPPPQKADWCHYGYGIEEHRNIGPDEGSYLCLARMKKEPCPPCEKRSEANAAGADDLAKSLWSQSRTLIYVIDRKDPSRGPLVWNISAGGKKSMDTDLLNLCIDPTTGETLQVDNPDDGYDLSFTREGQGLTTKYTGRQFARKSSPLSDDPATAERWLKFIEEHPLDSLLVFHDYDYLQKVVGGRAPAAAIEQAAPSTQRIARRPAAATPEPQVADQSSAAEAADAPPTWAEIDQMDEPLLSSLVDGYGLNPPLDGFSSLDALREWVAKELGVEKPAPAPAPTKGNWRDRLKRMQGG